MGRKSKYETHVQPRLDEIEEWYGLLNEAQITKKLGISVAAFEKYKRLHPELVERLKRGREQLIMDLKGSLRKKAQGFHYEETRTYTKDEDGKITEYAETFRRYSPPDTGAIHLLLKNLDESWRQDDKTTVDMKREKMDLEKEKAERDNW